MTAPPDPVEPGTTSDVPIHGEKTNVLFHPTPSVSYEPMYANIEARANVLCAGIFIAIAFIGKILGGSLWGLLPLGFCVASGVFLWMKDLVRQGRDTEWSSEQKRGETAVVNLIPESVEWLNTAVGLIWGLINPDMFAGMYPSILKSPGSERVYDLESNRPDLFMRTSLTMAIQLLPIRYVCRKQCPTTIALLIGDLSTRHREAGSSGPFPIFFAIVIEAR